MNRFKPLKWPTWVLICLSFGAFALLLWLTPQGGVILTRDSGSYISAGRSLLEGEGLLRYNRVVYARWPPLYPLVLAALEVITAPLSLDLLEAIRFLNALTYAALTFASGRLFLRLIRSPLLALLATVTLLFNWPLVLTSVHAWSEPLFNLLVVLFLLTLANYIDQPQRRSLVWMALLATLATLQRYSGIVTITTGLVMIVLVSSGQRKWRDTLIFGSLSITPLLLWNVYNQLVAGNAVGEWELGGQSIVRAIEQTCRMLGSWLLPSGGANMQVIIGAVLMVSIAVALIYQLRRRNLLLAVLLLIVSFTGLTMGLAVVTRVALDNRMYSPIFVPVTGLIFLLLEAILQRLPPIKSESVVFTGISLIFTLALLLTRSEDVLREFGILRENCCREQIWEEAPIISWLRDQPVKEFAWNNAPEKSRIFTSYYGNALPRSLAALEKWAQTQTSDQYIIWYAFSNDYNYRYSGEMLTETLDLETIMELDGSGLYRLHVNNPTK